MNEPPAQDPKPTLGEPAVLHHACTAVQQSVMQLGAFQRESYTARERRAALHRCSYRFGQYAGLRLTLDVNALLATQEAHEQARLRLTELADANSKTEQYERAAAFSLACGRLIQALGGDADPKRFAWPPLGEVKHRARVRPRRRG